MNMLKMSLFVVLCASISPIAVDAAAPSGLAGRKPALTALYMPTERAVYKVFNRVPLQFERIDPVLFTYHDAVSRIDAVLSDLCFHESQKNNASGSMTKDYFEYIHARSAVSDKVYPSCPELEYCQIYIQRARALFEQHPNIDDRYRNLDIEMCIDVLIDQQTKILWESVSKVMPQKKSKPTPAVRASAAEDNESFCRIM